MVSDALDSFESNWDDGRGQIDKNMQAMQEILDESVRAYEQTDQELADGLRDWAIDIPAGTAPGEVESTIRAALGGRAGTIELSGAGNPNPGIHTREAVEGWARHQRTFARHCEPRAMRMWLHRRSPDSMVDVEKSLGVWGPS